MRFRCSNFKRLFECLDFNQNGDLTLEELRFLEAWRADLFHPVPSLDQRLGSALAEHRPMEEICNLVEMGANPNIKRNPGHAFTDDDNSALAQAVERGTAEQVGRLLAHGADPRVSNMYGRTPLHCAAARASGHIGFMHLNIEPAHLIKHLGAAQADVNAC